MPIQEVNAQIALSDAQSALLAAAEKNRELQAESKPLKDAQLVRDSFVFGEEVYRVSQEGRLMEVSKAHSVQLVGTLDRRLVRLKRDHIGNAAGAVQGVLCRSTIVA